MPQRKMLAPAEAKKKAGTRHRIRVTAWKLETVRRGHEWQEVAKDKYGYTPEDTIEELVEYEVYDQLVEDLDIKAVIAAVNGAKP